MLLPRYTRRIELTLKSHLKLDDARIEQFLTCAVERQRKCASLGSPFRDVSVAIDEIDEPEAIGL